jgi:hypothetical protein
MLLHNFAGKTLTMREVYENHPVGRPYIKANYKAALAKLENEKAIRADPPASKRPKCNGQVTFADTVVGAFPSRRGT